MACPLRTIFVFLGIFLQGVALVHGANLVRFDFTGQSGTQTSTSYGYVDSHITAENITRGAGISPASLSNSMCSTGWSTGYTLDTSQNDYYQFSLTPQANYKFLLDHFLWGQQGDYYGPGDYVWRTSLDNYAQDLDSGAISGQQDINLTLGSFSANQFTSKLTFRDYAYYAYTSSGYYALRNNSSGGGLVLTGAVLPSAATASLWKISTGGSFNLASNWKNNTVPNGNDAAALLWSFLSADSIITVDSPVTLGTIDIDGQGKSVTLGGGFAHYHANLRR
jgi:hypothetical protein